MHVVNDTENRVDLMTYFAKPSDDQHKGKWGLRIKGRPQPYWETARKVTLIWYLGIETVDAKSECIKEREEDASWSTVVCKGSAAGVDHFGLNILDGITSRAHTSTSVDSLTVPVDTIWQANERFTDELRNGVPLEGKFKDMPGKGNLHFIQKTLEGEFEFDIFFTSDSTYEAMSTGAFTYDIDNAMSTFLDRFHVAYLPQPPFEDGPYLKFSQILLSNLMGGISYFHGTSRVTVSPTPEVAESDDDSEEKGPYELFTSVPSRSFFPRGFLWDEGFHLLLVMDWDMDLALDIITSWFNLMDDDGWIAREQILGPEARSKVPKKFQIQHPDYANPPTLFLVIQAFIERLNGTMSYLGAPSRLLNDRIAGKAFLIAIYPKLEKHYEWFRRTQAGSDLSAYGLITSEFSQGYRWRGRTAQHILTSGLDDYPRAQPPHRDELHVDALCWVGTMANALRKISAYLDKKEDEILFSKQAYNVVKSVDNLHWSKANQAYCDTTISDGSHVEKVCHKGYISLFPFMTGLIGPSHPHLEAVLDLMRDPEELRSPYGLRSLSLKDEYYGTDENYWRGPVWININFMVIERLLVSTPALHYLSVTLRYVAHGLGILRPARFLSEIVSRGNIYLFLVQMIANM